VPLDITPEACFGGIIVKNRRHLAVRLSLAATLMAVALSAQAQDAPPPVQPPVQGQPGATMPERTPEAIVNRLGVKLNLSADQKTQLLPIIAERQQKVAAIRADTAARPYVKSRRAKAAFEESDKKINAVLNEQQRQQYLELEKQMRQEMKQRMQEKRETPPSGDGASRP
jgi:periplasmic protein CpxP/Spy